MLEVGGALRSRQQTEDSIGTEFAMSKSGHMNKFTCIIIFALSLIIIVSQSSCAAEKETNSAKDLKVEIISPKEGERVQGDITIETWVNYPETVKYCEFYIQEPGAKDRYGWKDYSPPYFWGGDGQELDTTMFDDGQASVIVYVFSADEPKPKVQKRVHFIIDNGKPKIKIRSPKDREIIKGNVLIHVDAGDQGGKSKVPGVIGIYIYLDGSLMQRLTKTPFQAILDTCLLTPGEHSLRVVGEDTGGLMNVDSIVFIVDSNSGTIIGDNVPK